MFGRSLSCSKCWWGGNMWQRQLEVSHEPSNIIIKMRKLTNGWWWWGKESRIRTSFYTWQMQFLCYKYVILLTSSSNKWKAAKICAVVQCDYVITPDTPWGRQPLRWVCLGASPLPGWCPSPQQHQKRKQHRWPVREEKRNWFKRFQGWHESE